MKTASTDLFDLINSLTSNEKAYFKRYAGIHKTADNAYLKLFEVIAAQKDYCEEKVKCSLKNEKLVSYLPRAKKYLYNKILESMRLYHADKNIKRQLWRKYEDACFLLSRRQFKVAERLVQKIKEKAEASECWLIYVEALRLETLLKGECKDMAQQVEDWSVKFDETLKKAFNSIYFMLVYRLFSYYWNIKTLENRRTHFPEFFSRYLDTSKNCLAPSTNESQMYYQNALALYYKAFQKFDLSYQSLEKVVDLFEEKPLLLEKKQMHYFYSLESLISIDCERFDKTRASLHIQKVEAHFLTQKSVLFKNIFLKINMLTYHYVHKLVYCFQFALHKEALNTAMESVKVFQKYPLLTSKVIQVLLAYMYMLVHIVEEEWEKALYWSNFILSKNQTIHHSSFVKTQVWQLVIHMELKNYQLLESMLRNTARMWKQEKLNTDFHKELMEIFRHQMQQPYAEFWQDISVLALKKAQKERFQGVDNLHAFAQSRSEGRGFKELREELVKEILTQTVTN